MTETESLNEKIKTLSHKLQQRDIEVLNLRKELSQLRSDKIGEKAGGGTFPDASEKEIQKRIHDEIEKREKKLNEKFREMQLKYEKELVTAKQMYDSVATKVESAMAQERTIEAMTRDIKILEDEKKNMKLLHLEILKQNQIEAEIKLAESKKKMLEEIKKVQRNVSLTYLEQMDNSQKLTFLRNNQLEKEIDYRSVRMEELNMKNEKFENKVFLLTQELEQSKNSYVTVIEKNRKMGDMIRKLTNSLVSLQKEKDEEFYKLCVLCEVEPEKLRSLVLHPAGQDGNIKSISSRNNKSKSNNGARSNRKKKSKSKQKSARKHENFNSFNSAGKPIEEDVEINDFEINNNDNTDNKQSVEEDKMLLSSSTNKNSYNMKIIQENEIDIENENSINYKNNINNIQNQSQNNNNSNANNIHSNIQNNQENFTNSPHNFSSSKQTLSDQNAQNAAGYLALNSPNSNKNNANTNLEYNTDLNASAANANLALLIKNRTNSIINKEAFGKEIKNLPLMNISGPDAAQQKSAFAASNADSIAAIQNSSSIGFYPLKNREYISGTDLLNSVVFSKSNCKINNINNSQNPNFNLTLNNNNNNNNNKFLINKNNEIHNNNNNNNSNSNNNLLNSHNLNSSQVNPIINSINKSLNYSSNRVAGFPRENNLYQIYEKKIKNMESAMREKEKEFFRLKISFDNLSEKLNSYERKFQGIISLYEAGLKKLIEEEETLKNFSVVNFNFDFSTLKNFEFNKLSAENKFSLLVFMLNQIIPLVNVNEMESEFLKQNISMFKFKFYEEKLKNSAENDGCFRKSVSNFSQVKSLKEGKNPMNYVNGTLRNMHYNASSVGNINNKFKTPLRFLKDEKLNLNRKLSMYDYQVID